MFTTHSLKEVKASLNSIKEELEEQKKRLDMADKDIDILLTVPIECRDEQYYDMVDSLIDQYGYYLDRYIDDVKFYTRLVKVLNLLNPIRIK